MVSFWFPFKSTPKPASLQKQTQTHPVILKHGPKQMPQSQVSSHRPKQIPQNQVSSHRPNKSPKTRYPHTDPNKSPKTRYPQTQTKTKICYESLSPNKSAYRSRGNSSRMPRLQAPEHIAAPSLPWPGSIRRIRAKKKAPGASKVGCPLPDLLKVNNISWAPWPQNCQKRQLRGLRGGRQATSKGPLN